MTTNYRKVNLVRCEHCNFEEVLDAPVTQACPRCGRSAAQRMDRWVAGGHLVVNGTPEVHGEYETADERRAREQREAIEYSARCVEQRKSD